MDNHHLRGIILKLESRLSDDDRRRLHFFLGNDVPRRIRDDPSLAGTLSLMESLFDQDKINEQDFTFLIHAFDEIQCMDAVKLLREHMRRMQQSNRLNESIQSLASVMPPTINLSIEDQDEDKYAIQSPLIIQRNISDNSIEMISINNTNINPVTTIIDDQSSQSKRKKLLNRSSMTQKCLLPFVLLLSIIGLAILSGVLIIRSHGFIKELKMKDKSIFEEQAKNNLTLTQLISLRSMVNQTTEQLFYQLEQSHKENQNQNETIQQFYNRQSVGDQKIQQLTNQLKQSKKEEAENNQTIRQLNNQLQQSWKEKVTNNETNQRLNDQLQQSLNKQRNQTETIEQLTNQLKQLWKEQADNNQTIRQLTNQLPQLQEEQATNNQTIQRLNDQLQHSLRQQREQNETIQQLTNQLKQQMETPTISKRNIVTVVTNYPIDLNPILNAESTQKPNISNINLKWMQNGITIVRSHGYRYKLSQFSGSEGMFIDDDQNIYVADTDNNRIMKWLKDAKEGIVVAGGNGDGNRNNQLKTPGNVIVDKQNDYLIICDSYNRRVVRWPRRNGKSGETIIWDIECWDLTMDNDGYLYVSDKKKHEVRRWKIGDTNGIVVAGGNGGGKNLNQLNCPHNIFVDQDYAVYVSDRDNHRVMKWAKGAKEGVVVAGGHSQGNSLAQLSKPRGIIVDQLGTIYVADLGNDRVMRWLKGAKQDSQGSVVVGGKGKGKQLDQFDGCVDLSFDQQNNLYVLDGNNNRVQKFSIA